MQGKKKFRQTIQLEGKIERKKLKLITLWIAAVDKFLNRLQTGADMALKGARGWDGNFDGYTSELDGVFSSTSDTLPRARLQSRSTLPLREIKMRHPRLLELLGHRRPNGKLLAKDVV